MGEKVSLSIEIYKHVLEDIRSLRDELTKTQKDIALFRSEIVGGQARDDALVRARMDEVLRDIEEIKDTVNHINTRVTKIESSQSFKNGIVAGLGVISGGGIMSLVKLLLE